jgi:uncharacterized protein YndB with AHSA1/START domain
MGTSDENLVQLTRVLRAPPAEVFMAWTDPALLERWWTGAGAGWTRRRTSIPASAVATTSPCGTSGGAPHGVLGVYTEVATAARLAFNWTWENIRA